MSDILKHIYNACDPLEPATEEFYVDLAEVRGSCALADEFQGRLKFAKDYLHFLFSGHIGCGKSSELRKLSRVLSGGSGPAGRFFPVLVDASDYLDDYDADTADLLLAIVTELSAALRKEGVELKESLIVRRFHELTEFLGRDVDIAEGEVALPAGAVPPGIPLPKVKIQLLKRDPEARKHVRDAVEPRKSTYLEEINILVQEARLGLKAQTKGEFYRDIVLIVDNLERIQRFAGKKEGEESQRELFLEREAQLTGIAAHVVYTVPLRLARHYGTQLGQRYDCEPWTLPMVKVVHRGSQEPYEAGKGCLEELIRRRVNGQMLADIISPDALNFLLKFSGGHVRNLMTFVQSACTYTSTLPIPLAAAQRAIQQSVRTYSTAILPSHWEKLAALELSGDQQIDNGDEDYLQMLENLSVLEYVNGDDHTNVFESAVPWYKVHPIVRELRRFKAAVNAMERKWADDRP